MELGRDPWRLQAAQGVPRCMEDKTPKGRHRKNSISNCPESSGLEATLQRRAGGTEFKSSQRTAKFNKQ